MKEFIDKLIARLLWESSSCKVYKLINPNKEDIAEFNAYKKCIEIVNELAEEYINTSTDTSSGWIPCSERLPEEHDSMFAEYKGTDKWRSVMFEKISDDVNATIEYKNGTRKTKTIHTLDGVWQIDSIVKGEVIAWQPLPAPFKKGE